MKKYIFLLTVLLTSGMANAEGWTPDLTVTAIFTEGNTDAIVVYTSGGTAYTNGCSVNNWVFTADTDARRSRAYSTAMAALASGKKIRFWFKDTCAVWSYHQATSVMLVN